MSVMSSRPLLMPGSLPGEQDRDPLSAVVEQMVAVCGGAVLLSGDDGVVTRHAVADGYRPPPRVVDAIVRRCARSLLPATWPAADRHGWSEVVAADLVVHRGCCGLGGVVVLRAGGHAHDALPALLERLRAAVPRHDAAPASAAQLALVQLVTGAGAPDPAALGFSVTGCRLLLVHGLAPHPAGQFMALLASDERAVAARHPAGDLLVVVRDLPRSAGTDGGRSPARRVAALAARSGDDVTVGISAPVTDPATLPAAYADAHDAMLVAQQHRRPWVSADEEWAAVTVMRLRSALGELTTVADPLAALRRYDNDHRTSLAQTVAAWLDSNMDTVATAGLLNVHPNTLRYRLRRAETVAGIDLGDPSHRLVAQLTFSS